MKRVALIALLPGPAWAEVCDKARPGWDGAPATALTEAINLFVSPAGLALLGLSLIALRFRHQWIGLGAVLLWTVFITMITMADPTGIRRQAMVEGCIGQPTLFIAAAAAICVAIVLWTKPRTSDDPPPEA
ncbi:MAG: hypothetical protein AAFU63_04990 [Pseudomonadota bacterium]